MTKVGTCTNKYKKQVQQQSSSLLLPSSQEPETQPPSRASISSMCKSKRVARANGTYATTKATLQQTHLEALCFIPFRSVVLHPIATNEKAKMNVQVRLSSDLLNHLDHGAASEADCEDCWAVFVLGVLGAVGGPGAPSSRPERPRLCEKCLVRTLAIQHLPRFRHRSGRSHRS